MSACYSCGATLNKANRSAEHIIPNSIGGVLKSYRLLCRQCNGTYGIGIDAALATELEPLSESLNITRHRRKRAAGTHSPNHLPPLTPITGEDLCMRSVAKIAVNYYLVKERGVHHLSRIINVINGTELNDNDIHNCPLPIGMPANSDLAHFVSVKGNAVSRQLKANVVLFNTYSFAVLLCNTYNGDNVEHIYHYSIPRLGKVHDEDTLTT